MKKHVIIPIVALFFIATSFKCSPSTNNPNASGIKWMSWKEVQEAQKKEPRKIFVDVYTDWCGWCKRMDATTFTNPEIVKYISKNFYAVKFDAETQEAINFKGKDYKYVAQGARGYNELAAEILNGQMSYPTAVYFDENMEEIFPVPGYQEPKMLETILNYVQSNSYKNVKFDDYQRDFKGTIN